MILSESVFYDTSAWIALYDGGDDEHPEAEKSHLRVARERRLIVTSNFVFAETHAFFCRNPKAALRICETIRNSRVVSFQRVSAKDEEGAWRIIKKFWDKDFSYCDATSFALIERLKIPFALSFDNHFRQYGIPLYQTTS